MKDEVDQMIEKRVKLKEMILQGKKQENNRLVKFLAGRAENFADIPPG